MAKRCLKLTRRLEEICENRSEKKCVDLFYHRKKKVKKRKKLIYSTKNKIVLFCVFAQKTPTYWRNHLFSCKKTLYWCFFRLQKYLLFELKKFVWYIIQIFSFTFVIFLVGLYQLASVHFLIMTFNRFQKQLYHFLSYQNENY